MRGKMSERIIEPSGARGDQLVIIMWKKRDLKKRLYTAVCDSFDFKGFDPSPWTMLVFFNTDGSAVSRNGQKQCQTPVGGPGRHRPGDDEDDFPEVKELKHQQLRPGHRQERRTREPTETTADVSMGDPDIPSFDRRNQARKTVTPSIWKRR